MDYFKQLFCQTNWNTIANHTNIHVHVLKDIKSLVLIYRNDPKFSDRYAWANSVDPDQTAPSLEEQSDQGLHCLPFCLHSLDSLLYGRAT